MKFRLQHIVKSLQFNDEEKIEFSFTKAKSPIFIEFRKLINEEIESGYKQVDMLCTSTTEYPISEEDEISFRTMVKEIPEPIKKIIEEVQDDLYEYTINTIHNFRWVRGGAEPHNPIRFFLSYKWSINGIDWKTIPGEIHLGLSVGFPIDKKITDNKINTISDLVERKIKEPLSHELFCEAWNQLNENPRSSLVIGIAAAETGFKEFVSALLPDTDWLFANIQSPPLIKMLTKFLPTIQTKEKIKNKVVSPPKEIIKILNYGVELRNKIVHGKSETLKVDQVSEILKAVYDLLYLLDYYAGHKWAADKISIKTKELLLKSVEVK